MDYQGRCKAVGVGDGESAIGRVFEIGRVSLCNIIGRFFPMVSFQRTSLVVAVYERRRRLLTIVI